jgi:sec-independent protein translocase protein TatA
MIGAAGPFGLGAPELLIILAVVVLIFGVGKLSDVGGALGKSIREFRKSAREPDEPEETEQPEQITTSASTGGSAEDTSATKP